jgi:hypothetical protein
MSENVELAYRAFDAINRRDLGSLLALMDDYVEVVSRIASMEASMPVACTTSNAQCFTKRSNACRCGIRGRLGKLLAASPRLLVGRRSIRAQRRRMRDFSPRSRARILCEICSEAPNSRAFLSDTIASGGGRLKEGNTE